jgi:hypothetical protein
MKKIIAATAFAALFAAVPAIAAEDSTNMPPSSESSGPGVKGDPGSTSGPAMKPDSSNTGTSSSSGSSTGEQGMEPSQDATGVKGAPDSTSGPSDKKPGDTGTSK